MRKYKLILLFQLFSVLVFAQDRKITGNVSSSTEGALPGATVLIRGTNNATITDFDGNYEISIQENTDAIL